MAVLAALPNYFANLGDQLGEGGPHSSRCGTALAALGLQKATGAAVLGGRRRSAYRQSRPTIERFHIRATLDFAAADRFEKRVTPPLERVNKLLVAASDCEILRRHYGQRKSVAAGPGLSATAIASAVVCFAKWGQRSGNCIAISCRSTNLGMTEAAAAAETQEQQQPAAEAAAAAVAQLSIKEINELLKKPEAE